MQKEAKFCRIIFLCFVFAFQSNVLQHLSAVISLAPFQNLILIAEYFLLTVHDVHTVDKN